MSCSDLYGNAGGDWVGYIQDQYGTNGNISDDPLFCDPQSGDLRLHSDSPCAWANNPECGYVGAWPVGCGQTASVAAARGVVGTITRVFPNPTSGSIAFDFVASQGSWVSAKVVDVTGRVVRLICGGCQAHDHAGEFSLAWNGLDDRGQRVPPGVYVARVESAGRVATARVVLVR